MINLQSISISVQEGDIRKTENLVVQALIEKYPPADILREGLVAGMMQTEKRKHRNEILDSEVLIVELAMKAGLQILMPVSMYTQSSFYGTVITGTLEGDNRETEKGITTVLMQSLGLRVTDLGTSVSSVRFIDTAIEEKAQLIVCATAQTIFLPQMKSLVQAAAHADIRSKTKILFSGKPVTEWFCRSIKVDMYAPDPVRAAEIAAEYCRKAVH